MRDNIAGGPTSCNSDSHLGIWGQYLNKRTVSRSMWIWVDYGRYFKERMRPSTLGTSNMTHRIV
ncbi:hypothetical protein DY000_02060743 [Brassica cretica]|uniref:Uncharacterized protein n=1 Tax=Brassica cretica TaxID=69181 RepID=A0ABQ7B2P4_BRACR|nr:hypothetical protein DY000_02060743 [Brassica cretica]